MSYEEEDHVSADVAGLPQVTRTESVEMQDGEHFALHISSVAKRIGDSTIGMLAYGNFIET